MCHIISKRNEMTLWHERGTCYFYVFLFGGKQNTYDYLILLKSSYIDVCMFLIAMHLGDYEIILLLRFRIKNAVFPLVLCAQLPLANLKCD